MKKSEEFLDQFLSSVLDTLNIDEVYNVMTEALTQALNADGLLLMMHKHASNTFCIVREVGKITYKKDYCVLSANQLQFLRKSDNLVTLSDNPVTFLYESTTRQLEWLKKQRITHIYTIKYNNAIIGLLFIATKKRQPLSKQRCMYLNKICHYSAYALRNANLYQTAYRTSITDDLTTLYNRKYAFECIETACLNECPKILMLLDIDDFKLYNELYGASEGDNLIHRCAQVVLQEIGKGDIAFRFGADEFMVLIDSDDIEAAKELSYRIREQIANGTSFDMVWDSSITCGFSSFPDVSKDASSFIHNVEQAVYYGKMEGKGQTIVYHRGLDERTKDPDIRTAYDRVAPTIYALTAAIDAKDTYTFTHSINVSRYAVTLAEAVGLNATEIEMVRDAGLLHDIGKISIPENILKKTSRLTDEEYSIMKTHVENSTKMIRYLPDMDYVLPAVVGHHERYDGKGYPRGLAGENIPYMARILTVADCFDAMTAKRPYKQPLSIDYAVDELKKNSGTQFDPELANVFISLIEEGKITL